MLSIGDKAPEFSLPDQNGEKIALSDFKDKFVILYFYPKDMTPGCTIESEKFRDNNKEIENKDAVILGIGGGNSDTKKQFAQKLNLNFHILQDEDNKVATQYGVYGEKQMFGKKTMGINRTTYLIGPDQTVLHIWKDVKPEEHVEEVMAKLDEVKK